MILISGGEIILANNIDTGKPTLVLRFGQMISIFFSFSQWNGSVVSSQGGFIPPPSRQGNH
jgi:hypothetical protein